jgi:hypothetical protein
MDTTHFLPKAERLVSGHDFPADLGTFLGHSKGVLLAFVAKRQWFLCLVLPAKQPVPFTIVVVVVVVVVGSLDTDSTIFGRSYSTSLYSDEAVTFHLVKVADAIGIGNAKACPG